MFRISISNSTKQGSRIWCSTYNANNFRSQSEGDSMAGTIGRLQGNNTDSTVWWKKKGNVNKH